MQLEFEVDAIAGVLVVTARGRWEGSAPEKLEACLRRSFAGGRPVVVDLLGVTSFPEVGAKLVIDAHVRLGRRLRVVATGGGPVHRRLEAAGIAHVLALHGSPAVALAASAP